jgi:hypothetical protein
MAADAAPVIEVALQLLFIWILEQRVNVKKGVF